MYIVFELIFIGLHKISISQNSFSQSFATLQPECVSIFPNYSGPLDQNWFSDVSKIELFGGADIIGTKSGLSIDDVYQLRRNITNYRCQYDKPLWVWRLYPPQF